jgi:hypothetical protein
VVTSLNNPAALYHIKANTRRPSPFISGAWRFRLRGLFNDVERTLERNFSACNKAGMGPLGSDDFRRRASPWRSAGNKSGRAPESK